MKNPHHSTLHAVYAAQSVKTGKPVQTNWIAALLEAIYQLQRHQAIRVIRIYQRFLGPSNLGPSNLGPSNIGPSRNDRDR